MINQTEKKSIVSIINPQIMEEGSFEQVKEPCIAIAASEESDVVIDRVPAVTIRAPVTIEGIKMNAVVDTGAEVTVISERKFQKKILVEKHPHLQQAPRSLVVAEAGWKMKTSGIMEVKMEMGDETYVWHMYIASLRS